MSEVEQADFPCRQVRRITLGEGRIPGVHLPQMEERARRRWQQGSIRHYRGRPT